MTDGSAAAWMRHMRRGEWSAAWRVGDEILRSRGSVRQWNCPRHLQAVWDGTPIAGRRVLIRCYHGLGDTIQFIRYIPAVRALAAESTVWAQPALIPLLRTMRGIGPLIPLHDGTPEVDHDVDIEVMELPHLFRTTLATLPAEVPYLHPPCRPVFERSDPGRHGLAVGLVWEAGDWDRRRSVPVRLLAPLAAIPGVELHLLQRGRALQDAPAGMGTRSGSDDVLEAAAAMRMLDLVISVDSMPAHLAGALGLPAWTMLACHADWRWMEGRDDSPWYPSMRLFRQTRPGQWEDVINRVAHELRLLASTRGGRRPGPPAGSASGARSRRPGP